MKDKKRTNGKNHEGKGTSDTLPERITSMKKIPWNYVILLIIIFIGLFGTSFLPDPVQTPGRLYNIDSASIGYHNMKENEYLSQAWGHWNNGDYLRRLTHISGLDPGPGYFEEYPQPPFLSWMIISIWSLTGVQFWSARLIIILFSVATIPLLYLLVRRLTDDNDYLALTSAFVYSILPIAVFFGRNIQPESPALFFLVAGMYFYVRWTDDFKTKNLVFSGLALMVCALFKSTFLIGIIPMIFIFPFSRILSKFRDERISITEFVVEQRKTLIQLGYFAACFLPYLVWNWITAAFLNTKEALFAGTSSRIDLFSIFTTAYWTKSFPAIDVYLQNNYSVWFLWLAILGVACLLVKYRTRISKFCIGYVLAILPFSMVLADYINQHSYYQMPFVPLVCISSAYCLYTLGMLIKQATKREILQYIPLILLLVALPSAAVNTNLQYDTIFFGTDVGAEYINTHTSQNERLFIEGQSQSFGVCYNADRRCGTVSSPDDLMTAERNLNFTTGYIHVSGGGLHTLNQKPELLEYVESSYRISQLGLIQQGEETSLQYIIVQKDGISDLSNLTNNSVAQFPPILEKTYVTTHGIIPFYTATR